MRSLCFIHDTLSVIPYLCKIISPIEICKTYKVLKTKTVSIKVKKGLSDSPDENPNQYNGQVLVNDVVTSKNTHNKKDELKKVLTKILVKKNKNNI